MHGFTLHSSRYNSPRMAAIRPKTTEKIALILDDFLLYRAVSKSNERQKGEKGKTPHHESNRRQPSLGCRRTSR